MGGSKLNPNNPPPQVEHPGKTENVDPNKKEPPQLAPPLFGLGTVREPGVLGESGFAHQPGVSGGHSGGGDALFGNSPTGVGVHARGGRLAGMFEGNVEIAGNVEVSGNIALTGETSDITLTNGDCAEQFDVVDGQVDHPGTVMVLDDDGLLQPCRVPYDKRVAGVVSGAGQFRPALTLGVTASDHKRVPIALLGKVYCWADAGPKAIEVGDLLTSSSTEGHAMAATEPARAFGTVIGKALQPLASGRGLIAILVALQ
jgi:hypothetical protein